MGVKEEGENKDDDEGSREMQDKRREKMRMAMEEVWRWRGQ